MGESGVAVGTPVHYPDGPDSFGGSPTFCQRGVAQLVAR